MKEMLTGKNRDNFEKWFMGHFLLYKYPSFSDIFKDRECENFYNARFEMQLGVLLSYLREEYQVVLCVYTNASGFLWSVQNSGGTDLGWSGLKGNKEYGTGFKEYNDAFKDAFKLIIKCSFNDYHKCKEFTHCRNYVDHLRTL